MSPNYSEQNLSDFFQSFSPDSKSTLDAEILDIPEVYPTTAADCRRQNQSGYSRPTTSSSTSTSSSYSTGPRMPDYIDTTATTPTEDASTKQGIFSRMRINIPKSTNTPTKKRKADRPNRAGLVPFYYMGLDIGAKLLGYANLLFLLEFKVWIALAIICGFLTLYADHPWLDWWRGIQSHVLYAFLAYGVWLLITSFL